MGEYLPGQKIRILAVDDHALLRGGLASLIAGQTDMELVGEAENGVEATRMCLTLRPDVTLMDIQMPKMDGVDATQQIRHAWPTARIIILTTYRGDIQARRAIKAGASGYLLKSSLRHELFDAIRAVQSGQECIPADIAREIASHIADSDLSLRETQVLRLVAMGYSNRRIGDALSVAEDTVKGHMKSVMHKLGASDRTHAVTLAMTRGVIDFAH